MALVICKYTLCFYACEYLTSFSIGGGPIATTTVARLELTRMAKLTDASFPDNTNNNLGFTLMTNDLCAIYTS